MEPITLHYVLRKSQRKYPRSAGSTKLRTVAFHVLLFTIHCTIFQSFTIFQSRELIFTYNIVPIYLPFAEVHTPFAYIRDFPRALFCTLQVHCTILTKTNAIKCLSLPVFMTRTVSAFTHVTGYSHPILPNLPFIPCYNQSLFISIYHIIMEAYVSQHYVS